MNSIIITFLTTTISTSISALITGIIGVLFTELKSSPHSSHQQEPLILLPSSVTVKRRTNLNPIKVYTLITVVSILIGLIVGAILQSTQSNYQSSSGRFIVAVGFVLLILSLGSAALISNTLIHASQIGARKWALLIAAATTLVLVFGSSFFMLSAFFKERTFYFILDASANAKDLLPEMASRVKLGIKQVPDNVQIGLAVYGSNLGGNSGCDDITELVPAAPKEESIPKIDDALLDLSKITPNGPNNLQNTIIYVLNKLSNRRGVHQLFIITSNIDEGCGKLSRELIETASLENKVDTEIIVVTVGDVSQENQDLLRSIADRYSGTEKAEDITAIINESISLPPSLYQIYEIYQQTNP